MTERLHCHFSLSCIGKGNGNPLQCSCLENPRDGGAWWAAVSGVAQSRTRLSSSSSRWLSVKNPPANTGDAGDLGSILGQKDPLEEEMATHSSILAWKIPWTEEPGGCSPWALKESTQLCDWACVHPFHKDSSCIALGSHPTPLWSHLNLLQLQQPYFQTKSHSELLGLKILT